MAKRNINRVLLTGNLTRDPELRHTAGGTPVCELGLAVNESYKDSNSGEYKERANYFTITVWGAQGEACSTYLSKGRPIAVDGRLRYESWEDRESGQKRSAVKIVADSVEFLNSRSGNDGGGGGNDAQGSFSPEPEVPADTQDLSGGSAQQSAYAGAGTDDDIPF